MQRELAKEVEAQSRHDQPEDRQQLSGLSIGTVLHPLSHIASWSGQETRSLMCPEACAPRVLLHAWGYD